MKKVIPKTKSIIKSSPKGGIHAQGEEGDVRTTSEITPRESEKAEHSKITEIELLTAGQRRVNLIWESTQAVVAVSITMATIYTSIKGIESSVLTNAFFLIVSMYFVRTNHQLIGGTGAKPLNQQR